MTSIPTPTHIIPATGQQLVRMALPRPDGYSQKRGLWVPTDIHDVLSGEAKTLGFADPKFAGCRQRYVAGLYVTGAMNGDPKKRKPDFERLVNVNEVWVMCFRAPPDNQWRLMGRFVAHNEFVGLRLFSRGYLNGDAHYQKQAQLFEQAWPSSEPFLVKQTIEEYISQPVSDSYVPRL